MRPLSAAPGEGRWGTRRESRREEKCAHSEREAQRSSSTEDTARVAGGGRGSRCVLSEAEPDELTSEVVVQGVTGTLSLAGLANMTAGEQCTALRQSRKTA